MSIRHFGIGDTGVAHALSHAGGEDQVAQLSTLHRSLYEMSKAGIATASGAGRRGAAVERVAAFAD